MKIVSAAGAEKVLAIIGAIVYNESDQIGHNKGGIRMKKLLSMVLALMMCLSLLPAGAEYGVIGGADGPTSVIISTVGNDLILLPGDLTVAAQEAGRKIDAELKVAEVTGIATGDDMLDAALTDLLQSIAIRTSQQEDEFDFALALGQTDVLTFGMATAEAEAFVRSNLLGNTIAVRSEELEPLLDRLLDMMFQMEMLTEDDVNMFKEAIAALSDMISTMAESGSFDTSMTMDDFLTLDYSAVIDLLPTLTQKLEMIENPTAPKNCDHAAMGGKISLTNEDMVQLMKAYLQVLRDNPKLMNFLASQLGYYTEAQLDVLWDTVKDSGMYATEEDFRKENKSFESILNEEEAALAGKKLLDGTYDILICADKDGQVVYMTLTMPIFTEIGKLYAADTEIAPDQAEETTAAADASAQEPEGTTTVVALEYYRQTVAEGVSHVINLTADEETITIDTLAKDNTAHIVISTVDEEPVIIDATLTDGTLTATLTMKPDDENELSCTFEGMYVCTEEAYKLSLKLTGTNVYTPEEAETPSVNGLTLPGFESHKPQPRTDMVEIAYVADYTRNGVDFEGTTDTTIAYNDIRVVIKGSSRSSEAAASIAAEDAIRPAALDDAAFANWFVTLMNTLNSWTGTLLTALPESMMTYIYYMMGMMGM